MENKQKQIEEMVKIMFEKAFENYKTSGSAEIDNDVRQHCYSSFLVYCETLYNAGYRKESETAEKFTEKLVANFTKFTLEDEETGKIQFTQYSIEKHRFDEICKEFTNGKGVI